MRRAAPPLPGAPGEKEMPAGAGISDCLIYLTAGICSCNSTRRTLEVSADVWHISGPGIPSIHGPPEFAPAIPAFRPSMDIISASGD
jgi:hypothetical protein